MAEPTSSTEKAADAPADPAGTAADVRFPSSSESTDPPSDQRALSTSESPGTEPLTIEPNVVVETSEKTSEVAPARSVSRPSAHQRSGKAANAEPLDAYELLARSARLGDLVALTNRVVSDAARSRHGDWSFASKVSTAAAEMKLAHDDGDTEFGNVLDVLSTGGEGSAERALASALWAHAVAETPRARPEDEDRIAGDILWLATHTAFDATPLLDRALGEDAADLWAAIAHRIRKIDRERGGALGRGEAVFGCAALAGAGSDNAARLCATLKGELKDPVLLRVLSTKESGSTSDVRFEGELTHAPRGFIATTLLACTGILFATHALRLFARAALAYRRPAEVSLSEAGVKVKTRTIMLGRTVREREHVIVRAGLVRVVREVRFPRVAFYAGLMALALGSYIGVRTFVDGVRAASPSLLLVGLVVIAAGIGIDFVLGSLLPGARGRCRLAFVPRTGPTLCVGDIDIRQADSAIAKALQR